MALETTKRIDRLSKRLKELDSGGAPKEEKKGKKVQDGPDTKRKMNVYGHVTDWYLDGAQKIIKVQQILDA